MASNTSVVTSFILITVLKVWISLTKKLEGSHLCAQTHRFAIWNVRYFCPVKFLEISVLHMAFICKQFLWKAWGCLRRFCLSFFGFFFTFFMEDLAAIIYEQGGNKLGKMWLWRWASGRKTKTGRKHFYSSNPS